MAAETTAPVLTTQTAWSNVIVYLPPNTAGPSRIPPPPVEDIRPTPGELKEAFSSHIAQKHGPDAPLMTKAMREREEARLGTKKKEYNEIRVRVRFSDRTTLEGLFPASTQLPTLYKFVRVHLADRYAQVPFLLYQSPPRRDLPESGDAKLQGKTIRELGMAPQAIVDIRWSDTAMNANSFAAPLQPTLLAQAKELPTPRSFDTTAAPEDSQRPGQSTQSGPGETKKSMPKWLKGLQKK